MSSGDRTPRIQPVGMHRKMREVGKDVTSPVPDIEVPDSWYWNDSMCEEDGRQMSLRSSNWRYHIDIRAVEPVEGVDGPYYADLEVQVGPDDSFRTRTLRRIEGIEPGAVQDAVYILVGQALDHDLSEVMER